MRTTIGQSLAVHELLPNDRPVSVYRIVRSEYRHDPVLLNSLKSHYELGQEPRRVERRSAVLHMGISVFVDDDVARQVAKRFRGKLGEHIAHLELRYGDGFNYAQTGARNHLTLWGDPVKLHSTIVDIRSIEP